MRRVSIRDLSGDVIRNSASDDEVLGVTSNGALVGVLMPLTGDIVRRIAVSSVSSRSAGPTYQDEEGALDATSLREILADASTTAKPGGPRAFSRVSIRELSSKRLDEASSAGTPLVVTSDRVDVAVFLPLVSGWVDRMLEESVDRFLSDTVAEDSGITARVDPSAAARAELIRTSHRRFSSQRAIGIRIVGDARNDRERIVGVLTDGLAQIKSEPVTLPLERLDEAYVFEALLSLIDDLISRMDDANDLIGIGIEIGGHVAQGRIVRSANIRWNQFPLADQLSANLGVPVVLENDANALAIHERFSHGIGADNFAVVLLTHLGVGCGLILDGHLHRGSRGMAAELGHIPIEASASIEHRCRCGNADCLEAVATPQAIEVALHAAGFAGSYEDSLAQSKDPVVREIYTHAGQALGKSIASVLNLLNPEAVVLYGPLDLVGPPRQFHIDNFHDVADAENVSGIGRIYTTAMMDNIRSHVFSNAAEECQIIVRIRSDEQGAKSAAACVIHALRDRDKSLMGGYGLVPAYAERLR